VSISGFDATTLLKRDQALPAQLIHPSFKKLADMLLEHLDGIPNYCQVKVPLGVVEAINGNIKTLLRRGRSYKESALSAAEGPAPGRNQNRIRGLQKSRMNRTFHQFLAQSLKINLLRSIRIFGPYGCQQHDGSSLCQLHRGRPYRVDLATLCHGKRPSSLWR
jgi:hypothetical protein